MRSARWMRLCLAATFLCAAAWGQQIKDARIGYVYPAGVQQGGTFEITVGGRNLRGVTAAYVSGTGVHATVLQHYRPLQSVKKEQMQMLRQRMWELWEQRLAEAPADMRDAAMAFAPERAPKEKIVPDPESAEPLTLPEHPLLRNLDSMSLRQLAHVVHEIRHYSKRQMNMQIAESVVIEVTVDPDAAPGQRELRLDTPSGLSNPMRFDVGVQPEVCDVEPNESDQRWPEPALALPVVLNGQIMPGDVDRYRFRAKAGQQVVIRAEARALNPYLADAVPGWFQATLALYDAQGREVAFADDYRFDPDPVMLYRIPTEGDYELQIQDALFRGREDFVYRISVGELPFVTGIYPLGGAVGTETTAEVKGWNLPFSQMALNAQPGPDAYRGVALYEKDGTRSNPILYRVDPLPECEETEPNDAVEAPQTVVFPTVVNGRVGKPGDIDYFQFEGHAGQEVVVEVFARRLNSPLDSLVRLTDASGKVLEWNDDSTDKGAGMLTHHADSYILTRLPGNGVYRVQVSDTERNGGDAFAYRLRLDAPRPDFELRVTPSSINVPVGRAAEVCVHALRRDGFKGGIDVIMRGAPEGFSLEGGHIPGDRDSIRMTLSVPAQPMSGLLPLQLEGTADIGGNTVTHPAVPAEDMMQAFAYRQLVPTQAVLVEVVGRKLAPQRVELVQRGPFRLPVGGVVTVPVRTPQGAALQQVRLDLSNAPKGISLGDTQLVPEGVAVVLKADAELKPGYRDNVIVEAFLEPESGQQEGGKAKRKQRVSLGCLPAIPIEIVQP